MWVRDCRLMRSGRAQPRGHRRTMSRVQTMECTTATRPPRVERWPLAPAIIVFRVLARTTWLETCLSGPPTGFREAALPGLRLLAPLAPILGMILCAELTLPLKEGTVRIFHRRSSAAAASTPVSSVPTGLEQGHSRSMRAFLLTQPAKMAVSVAYSNG